MLFFGLAFVFGGFAKRPRGCRNRKLMETNILTLNRNIFTFKFMFTSLVWLLPIGQLLLCVQVMANL